MKDANDTEGRARKALGARWRRSSGPDPSISVAASEAFALGVTGTGSYSSSAVCRSKAQDHSTSLRHQLHSQLLWDPQRPLFLRLSLRLRT